MNCSQLWKVIHENLLQVLMWGSHKWALRMDHKYTRGRWPPEEQFHIRHNQCKSSAKGEQRQARQMEKSKCLKKKERKKKDAEHALILPYFFLPAPGGCWRNTDGKQISRTWREIPCFQKCYLLIHTSLFVHRVDSRPKLLSLFWTFFPWDTMVTIIRLDEVWCIDKICLFFYFMGPT